MAVKKSELYSSLWQSCDELRGGMDASQYKDYVLVLLFIKYISDKCAALYSIVSTARANGLEPYAYLRRLFAELPKAKTVEDFEAMLPFNAALI